LGTRLEASVISAAIRPRTTTPLPLAELEQQRFYLLPLSIGQHRAAS
jgi:hypothetical protein